MYRPNQNKRMRLIKLLAKLGIKSAQRIVAMYGILRAQSTGDSEPK